jgi:hypothetical protein
MSHEPNSKAHITEVSSPLWFYLPTTIAFLQNSRLKMDRQSDDFTPNGVNYTIIMLAVFYLDGCLEAWLREVICSVKAPDHSMFESLQIELLGKIGRTNSPEEYNKQVSVVCGRSLSELCPEKWEGFKALFSFRGALAHGRMVFATVTTDGTTWENSFNGGYDSAWKYLQKKGIVSIQNDAGWLGDLLLSDAVADYWVGFCRDFIRELGEALEGNERTIFEKTDFAANNMWFYPPK